MTFDQSRFYAVFNMIDVRWAVIGVETLRTGFEMLVGCRSKTPSISFGMLDGTHYRFIFKWEYWFWHILDLFLICFFLTIRCQRQGASNLFEYLLQPDILMPTLLFFLAGSPSPFSKVFGSCL